MNKMKTLYTVLSVLIALSIILTGCAAPAQPNTAAEKPAGNSDAGAAGKPVKLVVASFYPVDKISGWEGMVKKFNEKYPNVTIEVQVTPGDSTCPSCSVRSPVATRPTLLVWKIHRSHLREQEYAAWTLRLICRQDTGLLDQRILPAPARPLHLRGQGLRYSL